MSASIPPVTPAHAEGITATEQDVITAAVEAAITALDTFVNGYPVTRGQVSESDVQIILAAAAPIIAAAERKRIALAIEADGDGYCSDAMCCCCRDRREAAAIARAGTSGADHG